MKLYYFAGTWELPGQQLKGASRVDIPSTPVALVAWLNERRVPIAMPLNAPEPQPTIAPQPAAPCSVRASIKVDEDFDALPLARQLDLAARAMENARAAL